jgi:cyclopropane-fatty-acyl-phospholipid synthase
MINIFNKLGRNLLFKQLDNIEYGTIRLIEKHQTYTFGNDKDLIGTIIIEHQDFYSNVVIAGSIGASDSFIEGMWKSPNLTKIIRIMALNQNITNNIEIFYNFLIRPTYNFFHFLKRNNKKNSQINISKHYDLNNNFFSQFLDPSMMYSSAIYNKKKDKLNIASQNKLKTICQKLKIKKTDHIMEIGTGWGGFAIYAAKNYGCKITTTTISRQQYIYAKNKIKQLKLQNKIRVLFKDYRDLNGNFDKVVSIEMIEAVGHRYYDQYFGKISALLKDDGLALIQAITIRDQKYYAALKSVDFIQKYIFPGSCIPSITILQTSITNSSNMVVKDIEDIGSHYVQTLIDWRRNFNKNLKNIKNLGFDERFIRMWLYYFAYCEGGFKEKVINDHHILLSKPMNRDD